MAVLTKDKIAVEDFKLWDGTSTKTFERKTITGGVEDLTRVGWVGVDVLTLYGDGTDRNDATITKALTGAGNSYCTFYLSPGEWLISNDIVFPSNISVKTPYGATFSIDTGKTLTFYSPEHIIAGDRQQIFTGAGDIVFTSAGRAYPDWWAENATPGTTDLAAAINDAFTSVTGVVVVTNPNKYKIASHVYVPRQASWTCDGGSTFIESTNGTSSVIVGTAGEGGTTPPGHMENIFIRDPGYDYKAGSIGLIFGGISAVDAVDRRVTGYNLTNVRCEGFDIGMVSFNRIFNVQFQDCVWNRNNYNIKISQQGRQGGYQARYIGCQIANARKLGYWLLGGSVDAMDVRFLGTYFQNNGLDAVTAEGAIKHEANDDSGEGGAIGFTSFIGCHISNSGAQAVPTIKADEGTVYITNGIVAGQGVSPIQITGGVFHGLNFRLFVTTAGDYGIETTGASSGSLTNIAVSGQDVAVWDQGSASSFLVQNLTGQVDNTPKDMTAQGDFKVIGDITGTKSWINVNQTSGVTLTTAQCSSSFIQVGAAITLILPKVSTLGGTNTAADIVFFVRDTAETLKIDPDDADKINLYGTLLDAGDSIDSPGAAGDWIRLISCTRVDGAGTDGWIALTGQGTFTDEG